LSHVHVFGLVRVSVASPRYQKTLQLKGNMRYIKGLTPENLKILARIYQNSKYYQVRARAHCIILSYKGKQISELMEIFGVSRNTIYNWFNHWEKGSLAGLYNEKGRGRKPLFNPQEKDRIKQWVKETPKKLSRVQEKIKQEWEKEVSKDTIKRIVKILKMTWHRLRRRVGGQPDPEEYKQKKQILDSLKQQAIRGEIDLRYVDESGFCLVPYIPYAWQDKGKYETVRSQKSKRLNVLGFLNQNNELDSYIFECSINSEVVVACVDNFCSRIKRKTVLVMDQASIHLTNLLKDKQEEWKEKGLTIFFLPTYSPQLNLIEILWKKIKYEWLDPSAYDSWKNLVQAIENILKQFGKNYTINFA
jgi:transposase